MTNLESALALQNAGIAVIPIGANKVPAIPWKDYIEYGTTKEDVAKWFASPAGIGRLCGAVSGNLETIDFDVDEEVNKAEFALNSTEVLQKWADLVEELAPGLRDKLTVIQTPRPGWHVVYRCESKIDGNQKLAYVKSIAGKWKSIIETRGEGGYALCPNSPAWCHPKGGDRYVHVAGPSLENVSTITAEERTLLLQAARSFTLKQGIPHDDHGTSVHHGKRTLGLSPGDDFEQRSTWSEILEPAGFSIVERLESGTCYWRRPGSNSKWSASTDHNGSGLFYAFSPNCGVDPDRGYSRFSLYTHFNHGGDFKAATEELARLGYGQKELPHVDISAILEEAPEPEEVKFPPQFLSVPGIVAGMCDYMNATAIIPQPVLSLAASITFMGALIGRKVTDSIGSRANIYSVGLCRSGGGKDHARKTVKKFAEAADCFDLIGPEGVASGSGLISAVSEKPSVLFQLDEIGRLLRTVGNPGSSPHLYQIVTVLMKLFSSSNTVFQGDAYADKKKNVRIDFPNANIYGTTVPQSLFESLTQESLTDGFISRMLIFEGDDNAKPQRPFSVSLPEETVELIRQWHKYEQTELGDICSHPVLIPYSEQAEAYLWDYFLETSAKESELVRQSLWSRAAEKARKLALIHACSESYESPVVDLHAAEWACGLSSYLTERVIALSEQHVSENSNDRQWRRLEDVLRSGRALTGSQLHQRTRFLKAHERKAMIADMVDRGIVSEAYSDADGRGRPQKVYIWEAV